MTWERINKIWSFHRFVHHCLFVCSTCVCGWLLTGCCDENAVVDAIVREFAVLRSCGGCVCLWSVWTVWYVGMYVSSFEVMMSLMFLSPRLTLVSRLSTHTHMRTPTRTHSHVTRHIIFRIISEYGVFLSAYMYMSECTILGCHRQNHHCRSSCPHSNLIHTTIDGNSESKLGHCHTGVGSES